MIKTNLDGIKIQAIATAVPKTVGDLLEYRKVFGEEVIDKFSAMTGVNERRIAQEEQTSSDLAFVAAQHLLSKEGVNAEEIGACIFVTQTADYRVPATACVLAFRLNLSKDCIAFDVNLGCSGYVFGLNIAASLMKTNDIEKVLLLVGDTSNKDISPEDRSACMLFGDSGAATLLVKDENTKMRGTFRTDGSGFKAIIMNSGAYRNRNTSHERTMWGDGNVRSDHETYMNGTDVFTFTISEVPNLIKEYLADSGKTVEDFDTFIMQ